MHFPCLMARVFLATVFVALCALSQTNGLKCHEGFNMTLNGIPLYFWNERTCTSTSKCIGQQIAMDTAVLGTPFHAALRYGACMNSVYADYLDCGTLFDENSPFDSANLLDLIPGIETSINNAVGIFAQNASTSLQELLSDGTEMAAFVDGVFTFYSNLGFNLEKAVPLKPSLTKLLTAVLGGSGGSAEALEAAIVEFFNDFAQLETENEGFAGALRSILTNSGVNLTYFETDAPQVISVIVTALIERGPGLVRSIFPSDWQLELWYDVAFKLVGNINPSDWTKSTEDMVATIKSSYQIPDEIAEFVNPILDSLPDLARGAQIDPNYVGNWSLELLKSSSEKDTYTQAFSTALTNFVETLTRMPLQYEFKVTIEWMPGLFYKFFPGHKTVIQKVYMEMANGFNSFDFSNLPATAPETKLSMMIKTVVSAFTGPQQIFNTSTDAGAFNNALVVNFAKMFYNLMNVTEDYTNYIDIFSTIIEEEFKTLADMNVGRMIGELIKGFGGEIPTELAPILDNVQNIITTAMAQPLDGKNLINALKDVTSEYKTQHPDSPFPDLVDRYIDLVYELATIDYMTDYDAAMVKLAELQMELQYWNIDLQFAMIKSMNYSSDELYQMLITAWPEYDLFIRVLQAMDPEDVKQLIKDIVAYYSSSSPHTTQGLVDIIKPAFEKITKSIEMLMGEIRKTFSPSSCQFASCMSDLCNDQQLISSASAWTPKEPMTATDTMPTPSPTTDATTMSTTSSSDRVSINILNIATLWIAAKMFY